MRRLAVPWIAGLLVSAAYGWAELMGYAWSDYQFANEVPMRALTHGDVGQFLQMAPVDGPSLLLRAPFAFGAWIWGASDLAIYRMVAVPGLLAGAMLGVALWRLREKLQPNGRWLLLVALLAAGNPVLLRALYIGHPEEMLGAALSVGAVLAALRQRPWLAAVLLGLALGNKAWAVLAIGPVLLALEHRRVAVFAISSGIGAAFILPFLVAQHGGGDGVAGAGVASAAQTFGVFRPWQLWWFLGDHGHEVRGILGDLKVGYRTPPTWLGPVSHPLIAVLVVPASLLWRRRRGSGPASEDVLLLLATLFLARCVLDAANNVYYHLPFLMALLAWEALRREGPPVFSLVAVCVIWLTFQRLPLVLSPDAQCVAYLAWALPALAVLTRVTFRLGAPARAPSIRIAAPAAAVES